MLHPDEYKIFYYQALKEWKHSESDQLLNTEIHPNENIATISKNTLQKNEKLKQQKQSYQPNQNNCQSDQSIQFFFHTSHLKFCNNGSFTTMARDTTFKINGSSIKLQQAN